MTTALLTAPMPRTGTDHWADLSACRTANVDEDFFGDDPNAQARARKVCMTCPVRLTCLAARATIDGADSWGVVGGLQAAQRRALDASELLGEHADLPRAQALSAPHWSYRLQTLRIAGCTPQRTAEILTAEGFVVNTVTVRVALWWSGNSASLVTRRPPLDERPLWERVFDEHGRVIRILIERGVRKLDVANYLGIGIETYALIVQHLKASA